MYKSKEAFLRAIEQSMQKKPSYRNDHTFSNGLGAGRTYYRAFSDEFEREADTLEEHMKWCVATDLGVMARSDHGAHVTTIALGKLFGLTDEFIAEAVARWDGGIPDMSMINEPIAIDAG